MSNRVLVIEDEVTLARSIQVYLTRQGYEVDVAENAETGISSYQNKRPDITILDYQLGRINGLDVLREIRRFDKDAQVIMMTGHGNIKLAVSAMKAGARDFLTKPVPLSTLKDVIKQISSDSDKTGHHQHSKLELDAILGRSAAVQELKQAIQQIISGVEKSSGFPPPVLITGEPGTGKELIAKALHADGPRGHKKFTLVDCAAQSENEIDQLIFRMASKKVKIDANEDSSNSCDVHGGVIFFDEIPRLSRPLQAKLLRLLEDSSFQKPDADGESPFDIWFISSTNEPLATLTQAGALSKALLFRLQAVVLEAPPLRHRDSDMLFLAEHFIEIFSLDHSLPRRPMTADARAKLVGYEWPGNIRELRSVMERACLQATGDKISAQNINFSELETKSDPPLTALLDEGVALEAVEQKLLSQALERTRWNVSKAASLLGLSRDQMRYRIQKFKLKH